MAGKSHRLGVYGNVQKDCTSGPLPTIRVMTSRHRQLNGLRWVSSSKIVRSETRSHASHFGPDAEGLGSRLAIINGVGSGRTAEEICNLIMH